MARAYIGNYDVIALRDSYHGGNAAGMACTAHRSSKFNVPHSFGLHQAIALIRIAEHGDATIRTQDIITRPTSEA
jgi:4-aminobutyrate aminotransferase-like enzyme